MRNSDRTFRRRAVVGKVWEHKVVEILKEHGVDAVVVEPESSFDKPKSHYMENDIDVIAWPGTDAQCPMEIKSRRKSCTFTSPEDFPYGDVFVDTHAGFIGKSTKPPYYVFICQETGGVVALPTDDRSDWKVRSVYDKGYGYPTKTIVAPKSNLKTLEWLVEQLHARKV